MKEEQRAKIKANIEKASPKIAHYKQQLNKYQALLWEDTTQNKESKEKILQYLTTIDKIEQKFEELKVKIGEGAKPTEMSKEETKKRAVRIAKINAIFKDLEQLESKIEKIANT